LMFYEAGALNQDIGSWNISSLTNATDFSCGGIKLCPTA
jgi:surface protein